MNDNVNSPKHYTSHPSGIECIQVTEHMGFNLGNAVKYIWRCDLKRDTIEDLKKAKWYIDREIQKREREYNGKNKQEQNKAVEKIRFWEKDEQIYRDETITITPYDKYVITNFPKSYNLPFNLQR